MCLVFPSFPSGSTCGRSCAARGRWITGSLCGFFLLSSPLAPAQRQELYKSDYCNLVHLMNTMRHKHSAHAAQELSHFQFLQSEDPVFEQKVHVSKLLEVVAISSICASCLMGTAGLRSRRPQTLCR